METRPGKNSKHNLDERLEETESRRGREGAANATPNTEHNTPPSRCTHAYSNAVTQNPWWSLTRHACPKCAKVQFPWIDISLPDNQISHPCVPRRHCRDGRRDHS